MAAPMRIGALLTSAGKYVLRPEVTRPCAALLQHAPLTTDAGGSKATTGAKAPPPPPPKAAEKPAAAGPEYKVPEYYSYNPLSFYDIDASCDQHRLPQPSNKK
ncbi:hypothetical protein Bbelb_323460 [Branchiostoma belcheri]|nr:hypothetical protein Bbelb_323460 [Branchiostoma belcheri]